MATKQTLMYTDEDHDMLLRAQDKVSKWTLS